MPRTFTTHPADIVGYSRLAIEAVLGLTDLVETEHHNISRAPGVFGRPAKGGTHGITGLVYQSIRGVTKLVGGSLNVGLAPLLLLDGDTHSTPEREAALAVLNGILGEHLVATAKSPRDYDAVAVPRSAFTAPTGCFIGCHSKSQ